MKAYSLICAGMDYSVTEYGKNKKDAIKRFRQQWNLERKHLRIAIWEQTL